MDSLTEKKLQLILSSENVERIFMDCLFKDGEDTSKAVIAEGIITSFGFHPERLETHKNDIHTMLKELPTEFQEKGGGGWTFLNACNDKNGDQWTDLHKIMEQLMCLGIAIGKCTIQLLREMWAMFPGGMPYFTVLE
jgi:hypothetical protein